MEMMMTTNRQQWPKRFANALTSDEFTGHEYISGLLHEWLIDSLEPNQRMVYHFINIQIMEGHVTAAEIAYAYHLKPNHAATILKALYDLNLLKRQRVVDKDGKHFEYTLSTP